MYALSLVKFKIQHTHIYKVNEKNDVIKETLSYNA